MTTEAFSLSRIDSVGERRLLAAVAGLAALYLLQIASPLRIDNDAVAYLIVAMDLADGITPPRGLPAGYPWIVALLDRAGIASAPTIMLLNLLSVAAGLASVWYIGRDRSVSIRAWTVILTLLSYPVIRETMTPHPEAVYFGLSLVAVAAMTGVTAARSSRNFQLIGIAVGLIVVAVTFRIAAVSLVPPLLWSLYQIVKPAEARPGRRLIIAGSLSVLIALALGAGLLLSEGGTLSRYAFDAARQLTRPPIAHTIYRIDATLRAIAELSINLPLSRVDLLKPWVPLLGIPAALFFIRSFRIMQWRAPVSVYVATYLAMLIAWPFFASRLWIPILPLLLMHLLTGVSALFEGRSGFRLTRLTIRAWAVWFIAVGIAGMAYTTRITLAGEKFRFRYGHTGGMASPGFENSEHNANARRVIARYDAGNPAWRWLRSSGDSLP